MRARGSASTPAARGVTACDGCFSAGATPSGTLSDAHNGAETKKGNPGMVTNGVTWPEHLLEQL